MHWYKSHSMGEKMGQNGNCRQDRSEEATAEGKLRRELGRRIVKARTELGLSQVQLAKKLGIDRSRLSKWELGLHAPHLRQLLAISQILGLSLDQLIRERPQAA
jgi:ribosome-binding protein aMBF1 (putative translation factor)